MIRQHFVHILARDLREGDVMYSPHRAAPVFITKVQLQDGHRVYHEYVLNDTPRPGLLDCGNGTVNARCDTVDAFSLVLIENR